MASASSSEPKIIRSCINVYQTPGSTNILSRHQILEWVNTTLGRNYKKIEQLCDGLAYCHLMEMMFPGAVFLKKLRLEAKLEEHYIHNLKLLQLGLKRVSSDKSVPLDKLCKGRFQDNLEFVQWFKMFWDANHRADPNGSPLEIRSASWGYGMNKPNSLESPANLLFRHKSSSALNTSRTSSTESIGSRTSMGSVSSKSSTSRTGYRQSTSGAIGNTSVVRPMMSRNSSETALSRQREDQAKITGLTIEKSDLEAKREQASTKINQYYEKLIKIELVCKDLIEKQTYEDDYEKSVIEKVLKIAYAENIDTTQETPNEANTSSSAY